MWELVHQKMRLEIGASLIFRLALMGNVSFGGICAYASLVVNVTYNNRHCWVIIQKDFIIVYSESKCNLR